MAKGIRSKWKRKMRKIKRERNAPKELKKLKIALGLQEDDNPRQRRYKFSDIRELITKPTVNQATGTTFDLRYVPSKDVAAMDEERQVKIAEHKLAMEEKAAEKARKREEAAMEIEEGIGFRVRGREGKPKKPSRLEELENEEGDLDLEYTQNILRLPDADDDQDEDVQKKLEKRRKSLLNEHGQYPIWMSSKKVKQLQGARRKKKAKAKAKQGKVTKKRK